MQNDLLPIVSFYGELCSMDINCYPNGRTSIQLNTPQGPMARATINIPEIKLPPGHILIKNYSENEGMAHALKAAGIGEFSDLRQGNPTGHEDIVFMQVTHPIVLSVIAQLENLSKPKKQVAEDMAMA